MRSEPATWERILLHMVHKEGPHTQPRISNELGSSSKMICAGLSKLEGIGLVRAGDLVRDPLAQRSVREYSLTEKGTLYAKNLTLIRGEGH